MTFVPGGEREGRLRFSDPFGVNEGFPTGIFDEIFERMIYPMLNEGARILEEGIATRASDIDVIWIHGYGWPVWTGGPMYYADHLGLKHVAARPNAGPI